MSKPAVNMEILEKMLGRLNETSQRISKDLEKQAKQVDQRIKGFVDRGEQMTDRLIKTIETEVRTQIASMQHDVEKLAARVNEMASGTMSKSRVAGKPARATKTAPKKVPAKKAAVKKGAAKRPVARKSPAKRLAA